MARRVILGLAFLAALAASPAAAQAIPNADWTAFVEDSYSGLSIDEDKPRDWEERLYDAAQDGSQARAIARFGREIGVDPATARRYAQVIVAVVQARDCDGGEAGDCAALTPGSPAYEAIMAPALAEPTGELLWTVGSNLGTERRRIGVGGFVNAIRDHPARRTILSRLHDYSEDEGFLVALILDAPRDPAVLRALERTDVDVGGDADKWDGWRLAALEAAGAMARAEGATPAEQALYAQIILALHFNLGLTDQGLALWRETPPEVRALLPLPAGKCTWDGGDGRATCLKRGAGEALSDELTAALWSAGDQAGARVWLAQAEARLGPADGWEERSAHLALVEALDRTRSAEALFPLLIRDDRPASDEESHRMEEGGWAFAAYGPAARPLVVARVREAGYAEIAEAMERAPTYLRYSRGEGGELVRMADLLAPVAARRAELAAAIEAAWRPGTSAARFDPGRLRPVRPVGWTELRLPEGIAPWTPPPADDEDEGGRRAVQPPAGGTEAPVPSFAVARHEVIDGEQIVLFLSSEYDLPGELPAPGIWMVRTEGGAWTRPVYLGLQQHFPYVIAPGSAVPLLQDGRLRIEVQAREIDPASITFPPVGLRLAREEQGLLIERDLADLLSDGDGDGMTDVAERRLGLDPANADTDGDGLKDGSDPVPLTSRLAPVSPARAALAAIIVRKLTGHGEAAIPVPADLPEDLDEALAALAEEQPAPARPNTILMVGDPAMFGGLDLPFQLLVYTPEQIARLADGAPPSFPPEITIYSSLDDREHLVVWSASWVGGRFLVRCPAEGEACEVEDLSQWIT